MASFYVVGLQSWNRPCWWLAFNLDADGKEVGRLLTNCWCCKVNCTKEKTSFVSFKLWKANKQSESRLEGNGEGGSSEEKPCQSVPEMRGGSTDDDERPNCGIAAQTIVAPRTSDLVITPSLH